MSLPSTVLCTFDGSSTMFTPIRKHESWLLVEYLYVSARNVVGQTTVTSHYLTRRVHLARRSQIYDGCLCLLIKVIHLFGQNPETCESFLFFALPPTSTSTMPHGMSFAGLLCTSRLAIVICCDRNDPVRNVDKKKHHGI